jgi:hypothetical protein
MFAVAHAGIDDVDERTLGHNLQVDLGKGAQERCDHRRQHQIDRRRRRIDAQAS